MSQLSFHFLSKRIGWEGRKPLSLNDIITAIGKKINAENNNFASKGFSVYNDYFVSNNKVHVVGFSHCLDIDFNYIKCHCTITKERRMKMGNNQTEATKRYREKIGVISKSYRLKKELTEKFAQACQQNGVSQASQISKMMQAYIDETNEK